VTRPPRITRAEALLSASVVAIGAASLLADGSIGRAIGGVLFGACGAVGLCAVGAKLVALAWGRAIDRLLGDRDILDGWPE